MTTYENFKFDVDADGNGIAHVRVEPPADGLDGFSVAVPLHGPRTEGEVRIYLRDELAPAVRNAAKKHGRKYLGGLRELSTTGSQPAFLHKIREALL